jgi:hypothetical protein
MYATFLLALGMSGLFLNCLTRGGVCQTLRALLKGGYGGPMTLQVFMGVGCQEFFLVPVSSVDVWDPSEL